LSQMARMQTMRDARHSIVVAYQQGQTKVALLNHSPESSVHLAVGFVNPGTSRNALIESLGRAGVRASVHFRPINCHSFWETYTGGARCQRKSG
jgi:dTDP-4-amino-4,6-dideoxygalactose transaminase